MRHTVIYDKGKWDGYGNFKCSVCKNDVFIQHDSYEKESTGRLTTWEGKCYCLCDRCVNDCMDVGKADFLKDAKSYEPTKEKTYQEPDWIKNLDQEHKMMAGLLPIVALIGLATIIANGPEEKMKERLKNLKKK